MTADRSSVSEVSAALERVLAQARHLVARGRDAFFAEDLDGDLNQRAGERLIITLQAALDDLPEGFIVAHEDLPFPLVRGMRNRLAHGYDDVDASLLWNTWEGRLPEFVRAVLERLDSEQRD